MGFAPLNPSYALRALAPNIPRFSTPRISDVRANCPPTPRMRNVSSFVFQIHCVKEFRLYDAVQTLKSGDTIVLSPKPEAKRNPRLTAGATVYLWEAGRPQRGLIARGTVIDPLKQDLPMPPWQHQFCRDPQLGQAPSARSIIRIDHIFTPPIPRAKLLREIPSLAEAVFFGAEKNPSGTIFYVRPKPQSTISMQTLETTLSVLT
jgi:hypothetical protein